MFSQKTLTRTLKNDRSMKALTGLSILEFKNLVTSFDRALREFRNNKKRLRGFGAGRKGALRTIELKLFFILFYIKVYPTFDLGGILFGVDRSKVCLWIQKYLPILEMTLGRVVVLPVRKIHSPEEFLSLYGTYLIDGFERPTVRPKKNQKKSYSGKKKKHTRKNILITDKKGFIVALSPSKCGSVHDFTQLKKSFLSELKQGEFYVDKGFTGIKKYTNATIHIPLKKTKKKPLTEEDKIRNYLINSTRMKIEHSIGGIKRYNCVQQIYRNKKGIDDKFVLIASCLWNYHLTHQEITSKK